jgi:predicted cupin superfamily sugar epimerase
MHPTIRRLIELHRLTPLPIEGTLFAQTYRSAQELAPGLPAATAMIGLYCEEPPSRSRFHRLTRDELWHFYAGDPLRLILLRPDGSTEDVILGPDPLRGHRSQCLVPAGVWQAGHLVAGGLYALYGCTLAPGFTPDCFEGGTRAALTAAYASRREDIERLACPDDDVRMRAESR